MKKLVTVILVMGIGVMANAATTIWDGSTDAGFQNTNGTWGVDSYWTGYGDGETLTGWIGGAADNAVFGGGNASATPSGNYTVTVSGTQTVKDIRQWSNSTADYTLNGGNIVIATSSGVHADAGTFTVNSDLFSTINYMNLYANGGNIVLGGNNSFADEIVMRGNAANSVKLTDANALDATSGSSSAAITMVTPLQMLDLNGLTITSRDMKMNNNITGYIGNTAAAAAEFAGDVKNASTTGYLRAGGTGAEVNLSGVVSVNGGISVQDGSTLRLSGANIHTALTVVRDNGTLIVGNDSALGAIGAGNETYVNTSGTLDVNGHNIGSEVIILSKDGASMINNSGTAATAGGTVNLTADVDGRAIGGSGNLTLGGVVSGNRLQKTDGGTLTLNGANTHTGYTFIDGGILKVGNASALGTGTGASDRTRVNAGGTLDLNGFAVVGEDISLQGAAAKLVNNSGAAASSSGNVGLEAANLEIGGSGNLTLSGAVVGANGFFKTGAGTLTLGGANTYTGDTSVDGGSLSLDSAGQLAFTIGASGVNNGVGGAGTANFNGAFAFDLTGAGTTLGDSWLVVDSANLTETFGATFDVSGFADLGSGVWTLDNAGTEYQFLESNGTLSVIPEPMTLGLIVACGLPLFALRRLAM